MNDTDGTFLTLAVWGLVLAAFRIEYWLGDIKFVLSGIVTTLESRPPVVEGKEPPA